MPRGEIGVQEIVQSTETDLPGLDLSSHAAARILLGKFHPNTPLDPLDLQTLMLPTEPKQLHELAHKSYMATRMQSDQQKAQDIYVIKGQKKAYKDMTKEEQVQVWAKTVTEYLFEEVGNATNEEKLDWIDGLSSLGFADAKGWVEKVSSLYPETAKKKNRKKEEAKDAMTTFFATDYYANKASSDPQKSAGAIATAQVTYFVQGTAEQKKAGVARMYAVEQTMKDFFDQILDEKTREYINISKQTQVRRALGHITEQIIHEDLPKNETELLLELHTLILSERDTINTVLEETGEEFPDEGMTEEKQEEKVSIADVPPQAKDFDTSLPITVVPTRRPDTQTSAAAPARKKIQLFPPPSIEEIFEEIEASPEKNYVTELFNYMYIRGELAKNIGVLRQRLQQEIRVRGYNEGPQKANLLTNIKQAQDSIIMWIDQQFPEDNFMNSIQKRELFLQQVFANPMEVLGQLSQRKYVEKSEEALSGQDFEQMAVDARQVLAIPIAKRLEALTDLTIKSHVDKYERMEPGLLEKIFHALYIKGKRINTNGGQLERNQLSHLAQLFDGIPYPEIMYTIDTIWNLGLVEEEEQRLTVLSAASPNIWKRPHWFV